MDEAKRLKDIVRQGGRLVFFGGAGVSTESGLPDFRSPSSRQQALDQFGYAPEEILSAEFFFDRTETFYRYLQGLLLRPVEPNAAHRVLAKWERERGLDAVITQNIDGLHQKAGSKNVLELHGSLANYHCLTCGAPYAGARVTEQLEQGILPPTCPCGGTLKPDVVLYGEGLPEDVLANAAEAVQNADALIIGGTSLGVYPAAGLVPLFGGDHLVVVNMSQTPADAGASLISRRPVGELLAETETELAKNS